MREAFEETGLTSLVMWRFLGEREIDIASFGRGEIHHRHFFHLRYEDDSPDCWRHFEELLSDGGEPVELELYWGDMLIWADRTLSIGRANGWISSSVLRAQRLWAGIQLLPIPRTRVTST